MSRRLGMTSAIRAASVAAAVVAVVGCSDRSNSIMGVTPPAQAPSVLPTGNLGVVMGSVDENGNVTLTPLQGGAGDVDLAPGIDGQIYGTQNVNVRVYAAAATVTTVGSKKTWTMKFGVRNFLSFPIGSNQAGPIPTDTTGVFLAVISGPTVTQTSGTCAPPCAMQVATFDGTGTFTAPNQPYVHWTERLSAKQLVASTDTVSQRRTITFTSPLQVTNFKFFLIVGADWPAPNQTVWSLFYNAPTDSAADQHAKPLWRTGSMSPFGKASEVWSKAAGVDSLEVTNAKDYYLFRRDSLAPGNSGVHGGSRREVGEQSGHGASRNCLWFLGRYANGCHWDYQCGRWICPVRFSWWRLSYSAGAIHKRRVASCCECVDCPHLSSEKVRDRQCGSTRGRRAQAQGQVLAASQRRSDRYLHNGPGRVLWRWKRVGQCEFRLELCHLRDWRVATVGGRLGDVWCGGVAQKCVYRT